MRFSSRRFYFVLIHLVRYFGEIQFYLVMVEVYFDMRYNFILENTPMILLSYTYLEFI